MKNKEPLWDERKALSKRGLKVHDSIMKFLVEAYKDEPDLLGMEVIVMRANSYVCSMTNISRGAHDPKVNRISKPIMRGVRDEG